MDSSASIAAVEQLLLDVLVERALALHHEPGALRDRRRCAPRRRSTDGRPDSPSTTISASCSGETLRALMHVVGAQDDRAGSPASAGR